jgi:hypothetical protein
MAQINDAPSPMLVNQVATEVCDETMISTTKVLAPMLKTRPYGKRHHP